MNNKFALKLLEFLNDFGNNGEYVVISFEEIKQNFHEKYDENMLISALNYLVQNNYINIRYKDEIEMCYCSLCKARLLKETNNIKTKDKFNKYFVLNLIFSGLSAFLGAFLAIILLYFVF